MNHKYRNPKHPLDLKNEQLSILYKKFKQLRISTGSESQKISIQVNRIDQHISQLLASLLNMDISKLQKLISNSVISNEVNQGKQLNWNQFLKILQNQSHIRQNLLGLQMNKTTISKLKQQSKIVLFPSKVQLMHKKILINNFNILSIKNQMYYICFFDISTVLTTNQITVIHCQTKKIFLELEISNQTTFNLKFEEEAKKVKLPKYSGHSRKQINFRNKNLMAFSRRPQHVSQRQRGNSFWIEDMQQVKSILQSAQSQPNYMIQNQQQSLQLNDQVYDNVKKQNKRIKAAFQLFKVMPIAHAGKFSKYVISKAKNNKLQQLNPDQLLSQAKEYKKANISSQQLQRMRHVKKRINPYQTLKQLKQQTRRLSYNPYDLRTSNLYQQQTIGQSQTKPKQNRSVKNKIKKHNLYITAYDIDRQSRYIIIGTINCQVYLYQINRVLKKYKFLLNQTKPVEFPVTHSYFFYNTITNDLSVALSQDYQNKNTLIVIYPLLNQNNQKKLSHSPVYRLDLTFNAIIIHEYGLGILAYNHNGKFTIINQISAKNIEHFDIYFSGTIVNNITRGTFSINTIAFSQNHNQQDIVISIMIGTLNGFAAIFTYYGKQITRIKKLSDLPLVASTFSPNQNAFITASCNSTVFILDEVSFQILFQCKVGMYDIRGMFLDRKKNQLYIYGAQVKKFRFVKDQQKQFELNKNTKTKIWRQKKLLKDQDKNLIISNPYIQEIIHINHNEQYFLLINTKREVKIFKKNPLRLKHSFYINILWDIVSLVLSQDSKILAVSLGNNTIRILNTYTEQIYESLQSINAINIEFLPKECQYLLITTSIQGRINLLHSNLKSKKNLGNKTLTNHSCNITAIQQNSFYLITGDQKNTLCVFSMPMCILKFSSFLQSTTVDHYFNYLYKGVVRIKLCQAQNSFLVILESGDLFQIALLDGFIITKSQVSLGKSINSQIYFKFQTLITVNQQAVIKIFNKDGKEGQKRGIKQKRNSFAFKNTDHSGVKRKLKLFWTNQIAFQVVNQKKMMPKKIIQISDEQFMILFDKQMGLIFNWNGLAKGYLSYTDFQVHKLNNDKQRKQILECV